MPTAVESLDLATGIGQRQGTFTFMKVEASSGRPLGELHPVQQGVPSLQHDATRAISRTISGLLLSIAETAELDPLAHRLTVAYVIGGTSFPLGTYVFTDDVRARNTAGRRSTGGLADLMFVVSTKTETAVSFLGTTNVGTAIASVLASVVGLSGYTVEPTASTIGTPIAWPPGTDRARILQDLAKLGGYFSPFMANDSKIHVVQAFDPATIPPTFTLEADTRIINDSISETTDLLDAPNRWIVKSNSGSDDAAIVGVYDVPTTAPYSAANRGFVVPAVVDVQGLLNSLQAEQMARSLAIQNPLFLHTTLATPVDPRHDGFDVIRYDGSNWLETGWSMPLVEGAQMAHTLQRAYGASS